MEQIRPIYEPIQSNMLSMIRSARSRLNKDSNADAMLAAAGRHRLPGSRSTADHGVLNRGSENAVLEQAPPPPHAPSAPTAVLGDVTNTALHTGHQGLKSPSKAAEKVSSAQAVQNSGSTCTSTPLTPEVLESDVIHADDPQYCVEYIGDIYRCLQSREALHLPVPSYMERQPHINAKMRAILVDWLVDVHKKYKLRPETLFLGIALVDRFLEKRVTQRRHLQLVGVTGLLIAAKFEEVYPPQIHDFVYVTDKAYTREEVVKMEVSMLSVLDFKLCQPTAAQFLERYQIVNGCTEAHGHLAQYLLELTLVDFKMIRFAPSHLAAAAIFLSNKLLRCQPSWTPAAVKHTGMTEQSLRECAKEICAILEYAEQNHLQAVRKKFSQMKYHAVAKLNFAGAPNYTTQSDEARSRGRRSSTGRRNSGSHTPMDVIQVTTLQSVHGQEHMTVAPANENDSMGLGGCFPPHGKTGTGLAC